MGRDWILPWDRSVETSFEEENVCVCVCVCVCARARASSCLCAQHLIQEHLSAFRTWAAGRQVQDQVDQQDLGAKRSSLIQ